MKSKSIASLVHLTLGCCLFSSNSVASTPVSPLAPAVPAITAEPALLPGARLAGSARMRAWGFDIYQASLWVTPAFQASAYWQTPFALELSYLRTLEGAAIAQRSLDEMQRASSLPSAQASDGLAKMTRIFPNVNKGDTLTGLHTPEQGARFLVNGQPLGDIAQADFSRRFFGIWLGASTSAPGLRAALLRGVPS